MLNRLPEYLTITNHPTDTLNALIKEWKPDKVGILVDENTRVHCLSKIEVPHNIIIEIKSGEEHKNLDSSTHIWQEMTNEGFTRKSLMINLGGGVIGDMGGFAASTFKRGIRFINIPTTLLSQVDASIGGKLGIDFGLLKNHIGVFKEPGHVIINTEFLNTLSKRELKSGFAEVIKHSLIADKEQWRHLKTQQFDQIDWNSLIPSSIALKNKVVNADPTEKGLRKILNFGHTLGHALESHFIEKGNRLLHGEAIAIGMILESHLSLQKEWITNDELEEIKDYILSIFQLPKVLPNYDSIKDLLLQDKKNDALGVSFSLIKAIGNCSYDDRVNEETIKLAMGYYESI